MLRIRRRRRSPLGTFLDDLSTGSPASACRRYVRRKVKVRRTWAEQLRRAKELRARATTEAEVKEIDEWISTMRLCRAALAEAAKRLAERRAELDDLNRGTLQERADKALRLLRERGEQRYP